ncbi:MAG: CCA tRNA nucleotidyltransferase [Planctomycetota bacterium]|nr:MAG: CCA tRNA nucleotidyltransferase [Planctomycetota bacterium]
MQRIPWTMPDTPVWLQGRSIIQRIQEAGYRAVFVGGCIRDQLMGDAVADIDIASDAPSPIIEDLFPHTVAVGKAFGVIIVVDQGRHFEVAQFRHDGPSLDSRHPQSIRPGSEAEDVLRRDFTFNALIGDPQQGEIRDHVQGLQDLQQRRLRLVGDAKTRLGEDHLRILRAARFAARFTCTLCPDTAQALCEVACEGVSKERVWSECDKVFGQAWQGRWIDFLVQWGHWRVIGPSDVLPHEVLGIVLQWWEHPLARDPMVAEIVLWHACIHYNLITDNSFSRWYADQPVTRERKKSISRALSILPQVSEDLPEVPQRQRLVRETIAPQVAACLQVIGARSAHAFAQSLKEEQERGPIPQLLSAQELITLGIARGPQLGVALRGIEDAWLSGRISDTQQARAWVHNHYL